MKNLIYYKLMFLYFAISAWNIIKEKNLRKIKISPPLQICLQNFLKTTVLNGEDNCPQH